MRARAALLLVLAAPGCAEIVWVPGLALPWWEVEDTVPTERMDDDCEVRFDEVLLGIPSGAILDPDGVEAATLPGGQALQLVGASPTTLGEIRLASETPAAFRFDFGAPGDPSDPDPAGARAGNATPEQRARLAAGAAIRFTVTCDASLTVELTLHLGAATCPVADDLEISSQGSFSTLLSIDPAALLGPDPQALRGTPWIQADSDSDGTLSDEERTSVATDEELATRLAAALISEAGPCDVVTTP